LGPLELILTLLSAHRLFVRSCSGSLYSIISIKSISILLIHHTKSGHHLISGYFSISYL
jgi:hypothetical protein